MASNSFGKLFRITTWGESHGKAMGVVIDGCPAGLSIDEEYINHYLSLRAPGKSPFTSPRKEPDQVEIYSGVFEGKTTGAPISLIIPNRDSDSSAYEEKKHLLRPGHANYTYLEKYGIFDYRGGGRASARETVCRVAAGAVARRFLEPYSIFPIAYIKEIHGIQARIDHVEPSALIRNIQESPLFCPDPETTLCMMEAIETAKASRDSVGGLVELYIPNLPVGLGDPIYDKIEAKLAAALMSLPASKGIEIGSGFQTARMRGSECNDLFAREGDKITTTTNHAGGTLGGITNGRPLVVRIAFKPPSSIAQPQPTVDLEGNPSTLEIADGSRHDPCVAIRAVPVVEAMTALVLADTLLSHRCTRC